MKFKVSLIAMVSSLMFLLSCDTISQVLSFTNCKYEIAGLAAPSIAGVSLSNINNVTDMNPMSMLKVVAAITSGNLPLSMTVNVNATNPNNTVAQIEGLDWAVDLENTTMFTGNVGSRVTVPANGGKTIIPLNFDVNLMEVLKGESKDNMLNFVQGALDMGNASSKVSLRIKPSVMIANQKISTGFITLSKNVGK